MNARNFFEINESNAKMAHNMMSMSDYSTGSVTAEYHNTASVAYDLAD